MANTFPEVLPVRLPEGARRELAKLAKSRYQSACAVARQAIMREIDASKSQLQISGVDTHKHAA